MSSPEVSDLEQFGHHGKLTHSIDVTLTEDLRDEIVIRARAKGMKSAQYVREVLQAHLTELPALFDQVANAEMRDDIMAMAREARLTPAEYVAKVMSQHLYGVKSNIPYTNHKPGRE